MKNISIIIPVYFNAQSIEKTILKIKQEVIEKNKDYTFEIICIDDGSGDNSYQILLEIQKKDKDLVKVIKFTRNFGQVQAIFAGYEASSGACVVNISADLQDPPELMNEMISNFFIQNIPIVIGIRIDRDESFYRKFTSQIFYKLMQKLSFSNMPIGGFDYALLSKEVVKVILANKEANPFWQGQILWSGFPIKFIPYIRRERAEGKSRWTFGKKIKYLIDGVLAYSYFPLRAISVLGGLLFLMGVVYSIIIVFQYYWGNVPFKGWTPIMILILLLFGIVLLMLGIIGEYLWRVLDQVRGRAGYLIEK